MVMERSKHLVRMGLDAATGLLPRVNDGGRYHDAHLWVLFQGFANGFYTVFDTLKNVEKNSGDAALRRAIDEWMEDIKGEREAVMGNIRNLMTHQGKFYTTQLTQEWENDPANDTVYPVLSHVFCEVTRGGVTEGITFDEWARSIFCWWDRQLPEIERRYNRFKRMERRKAEGW